MPRPRNVIPSRMINLALPEPVYAQLSLHLFSDLEQRVPVGAYQRFFSERIREFFSQQHLDLAPFFDVPPGTYIVSGSPEVIRDLYGKLSHE